MNPTQIYIAISIVVLAIIALLVFFVNKNKKGKKLTPLASLAFGFVLAGIIFGDDRLISYSLMGVGVILAIIDMIKKLRKNDKQIKRMD
jgi:amino acid transporter